MRWVNAYDENQSPIQIPVYEPWEQEQEQQFWPQVRQKLYYKDKRTGEVKYGVVVSPGNFKFWVEFEGGRVKLDKEVINKRLFVFEEDALNFGKMITDG